MYKRLELHNHTNESDAVFTCKELTDFMVADHVDAFALTDHNTISGHYKIENYLKEHPQAISSVCVGISPFIRQTVLTSSLSLKIRIVLSFVSASSV